MCSLECKGGAASSLLVGFAILVLAGLFLRGLCLLLLSSKVSNLLLRNSTTHTFENVGVILVELTEHFLAVLGSLQFAAERLDLLKNFVSKFSRNDIDDFLKDVVTKDMGHKFANNLTQADVGDS